MFQDGIVAADTGDVQGVIQNYNDIHKEYFPDTSNMFSSLASMLDSYNDPTSTCVVVFLIFCFHVFNVSDSEMLNKFVETCKPKLESILNGDDKKMLSLEIAIQRIWFGYVFVTVPVRLKYKEGRLADLADDFQTDYLEVSVDEENNSTVIGCKSIPVINKRERLKNKPRTHAESPVQTFDAKTRLRIV